MRRVVVTGAAGGIGAAIVARFVGEADQVVGVDADATALDGLASGLDRAVFEPLLLDLRDVDAVRRRIGEVAGRPGGIAVVVNAAGRLERVPFDELTVADWDSVLDVNLRGPFVVTQAALPGLARGAVVVNVSSIQAEVTSADLVHYAASKGGVRQLTKAMAVALGPKGIRVVAVGPGTTLTAMNRDRVERPELRAAYERDIPLGRIAEPRDIADAVAMLASTDARHVTGVTLYVDGGGLAQR